MKTGIILAGVVLSVTGTGAVTAADAIDELNAASNVFDTPTPEPFEYSQTKPKKSELLPRAYATLPPRIPHRVDEYLPITAADNQCLDCHEDPDLIGKKKKGKSPMPRDHYVDLRSSSDEMSEEIVGARFNCTQCHVPQSGAPPLVENTFQGSK